MSDFAFTKAQRLLTRADFSYVFDQAPIRVSDSNILILAKPSQKPQARLGLVIAKKHVKKAVERNRIKRIARESFRMQHDNMPTIDVIILARKGIDRIDNQDIHSRLNTLWKRCIKQYHKIDKQL